MKILEIIGSGRRHGNSDQLVALTNAATFPFPSYATKCTPLLTMFTSSNPPTPPAPSALPLKSVPHIIEATRQPLVFRMASTFHPSYANRFV